MAAAGMLPVLNRMLEDAEVEAYADVEAAVDAADTVRDAVESLGILDELEPDVAEEARAVLDAIPPAVDEAIIAALENAFEHGRARRPRVGGGRPRNDRGAHLRGGNP